MPPGSSVALGAGLDVPVLTVFDGSGRFDPEGQGRLLRHLVQSGDGADSVTTAGVAGEGTGLPAGVRKEVAVLAVREIAYLNRVRLPSGRPRVELWVSVTDRTVAGMLDRLREAVAAGADGCVLAPLCLEDAPDPVEVLRTRVPEVWEEAGRVLPVVLYDNADLAVDPDVPHIRTRDVKRLSRLDWIVGIKVTAPPKVLRNYTRAANHFKPQGAFGVRLGDPMMMFDLYGSERGPLRRFLDRSGLAAALPVGVASGFANVWPREWRRAWEACRAGDAESRARFRVLFEAFSGACVFEGTRKTIACLKRALVLDGTIGNDTTAPGTPALVGSERETFDERYAELRERRDREVPERRRSDPAAAEDGRGGGAPVHPDATDGTSAGTASPGRRTLDAAIASLQGLVREGGIEGLLPPARNLVLACLEREGRVHFTGIGKSGHVADKARSTWSSLDLPAYILHAVDAIHGDAGQVRAGDVVVAISHGGETEELLKVVDCLLRNGARLLAVTGKRDSALARAAEVVVDYRVDDEGDPLGMAPMASVLVQGTLLDALASEVAAARGLARETFRRLHPGGSLGKG